MRRVDEAGAAPPLDLEGFLPYRAARLAAALSRGLARRYESRFQVSVAEWRVLVHLTQQSRISVRDIHVRVDIDRVRVTRAVKRLEARGLVSKFVNETDRRLVRLALTARGARLADNLARVARDFEAEIKDAVPDGCARDLLRGFDGIEAALADLGDAESGVGRGGDAPADT